MTTTFPFIEACFGRPTPHTPIWIMRQAGRYLPEYRAVRETTSFWGLCKTPELACEVTLQPLRRMELDAAIIFSDILVPVQAMGMDIEFHEGKGPLLDSPLRSAADIERLCIPEPLERMAFLPEAIRLTLQGLGGKVPLIGFSGAPLTLASYMIEGGGSKNHMKVKEFMYREPALWERLMSKLVPTIVRYLNAQMDAGVQAIQLFDSWAGILSPRDYRRYALPYSRQVLEAVRRPGIPIIHFGVESAMLLADMATAGSDVVGLDWKTPLDWGRGVLDGSGRKLAAQGNLDPCVLFAEPPVIREQVQAILAENAGRAGHIFNLGHGILPPTNPDHAKYLVDTVHELSAR